ncbi:MAG TPA: LysR family transcriptional regulator [Aliidongia sp.]|nr:LysR family transcriptional regulator [Aliidongia sp.]
MQLHQVRYFLALAETLNFTRAAEMCNVSQSALTKAVQKLERELDGPLVHRERHFTQLTDLGKVVLPMLSRTFAAAEAVRAQARAYKHREIAPLKVGLVPSISATVIVDPLADISRLIPGLQVEMVEAQAEVLLGMLLEGDLNVALVGDCSELPERIDHWRLFDERYVVLAAASHPLAQYREVPLDALEETVWLGRIDCEIAGRFRQVCFAENACMKVGHRGRHENHLQHMAAAGLGAMLAPEHAPRLASLRAIPLEGDPLRREVQLLVVAGRRYSPALDAFIKIARLRDWGADIERPLAITPVRRVNGLVQPEPDETRVSADQPDEGVSAISSNCSRMTLSPTPDLKSGST